MVTGSRRPCPGQARCASSKSQPTTTKPARISVFKPRAGSQGACGVSSLQMCRGCRAPPLPSRPAARPGVKSPAWGSGRSGRAAFPRHGPSCAALPPARGSAGGGWLASSCPGLPSRTRERGKRRLFLRVS